MIFTNTAFPAFLATSDQPFYAAMNITEAIAEVYVTESGFSIDKMNDAKDLALRKASELKNQLEEEKIQKEKKQKRRNCELCGAEIDFKSPLARFCVKCSEAKSVERKFYKRPCFKKHIEKVEEGEQRLKTRENRLKRKYFKDI